MKLIIAEKPSVAQEIAKVVNAAEKKNSYIQGNGYIVSWCYGHLIALAQPQDYEEKYKKWTLEDLPIIPVNYKLTVNEETKDHFYMLKNLMNREDIKEIICATDSGREGELIFRLVYEKANFKKPFKRLWISSLTEESIRKGFENLQDGHKYDSLYQAGLKRAIADWLVGMNASRMYSLNYGNKVTIGRVQTPTLAMLVNRENEIQNFKKEKNYKIILSKNDFIAESEIFKNEKEFKEILEKTKDKKALCIKAEKENITKAPPKLYDLTSLQRDCNKILGLTAQETLNIAQNLYEKKLITYPRTDSRYISDDMEKETKDIINILCSKFNSLEPICNINQIINNDKITDHHAIIPTQNIFSSVLEKLKKDEINVYYLICKRLLESVHKSLKLYKYMYCLEIEKIQFYANYDYIYDYGYLEIEKMFLSKINVEETDTEDINLKFDLKENEYIENFKLNIHEYFTSPPKRYTEDTLLSAMENASKKEYKNIEENEDVEKKGLGTPATRAAIIEKLISVEYIERKGKSLIPTKKGINAIKIVDEKMKSPTMTAEWEVKLQNIEKGNFSEDEFLSEIINFVKEFFNKNLVNTEIKKEMQELNENLKEKEIIGICPKCKANVYEADKNFYCSNKDCNFTMFKEDKFFKDKKVKLTKTKVKSLLKNGQVEFDKLYSEKKNKFYSAKVGIEITDKYVNYKLIF